MSYVQLGEAATVGAETLVSAAESAADVAQRQLDAGVAGLRLFGDDFPKAIATLWGVKQGAERSSVEFTRLATPMFGGRAPWQWTGTPLEKRAQAVRVRLSSIATSADKVLVSNREAKEWLETTPLDAVEAARVMEEIFSNIVDASTTGTKAAAEAAEAARLLAEAAKNFVKDNPKTGIGIGATVGIGLVLLFMFTRK